MLVLAWVSSHPSVTELGCCITEQRFNDHRVGVTFNDADTGS